MKRPNFSTPVFKTVLSYAGAFFAFFLFEKASPVPTLLSVAPFVALSYVGLNPLILAGLSVLGAYVANGIRTLLPLAVALAVLSVVFFIYRLQKSAPRYELLAYLVLALLYYVLLGDGNVYVRIILSLATVLLSFMCVSTANYLLVKGVSTRPTAEESVMGAVVFTVAELGLLGTFPFPVCKAFFWLLLLVCARVCDKGGAVKLAVLIGMGLCVFMKNVGTFALFPLPIFFSELLCGVSPYLAGLFLLPADYAFYALFRVYPAYTPVDFIGTFIPVLLSFLIPKGVYERLFRTLAYSRSNALVRQTVNRSRTALGERLYALAGVMQEISSSLQELGEKGQSGEDAEQALLADVYNATCVGCKNAPTCDARGGGQDVKEDLRKLAKIGLAKGRVSFIDMPKSLSDRCFFANELLFAFNKELADRKKQADAREGISESRELILKQAGGVAEMLGALALETSETTVFRPELEKAAFDALTKKGVSVLELFVFGEGEKTVVSFLSNDPTAEKRAERALSRVFPFPLQVYDRAELETNKTFYSLRRPYPYRVAYGVATATKAFSALSGDTHSEIALPGGKFLFALSDGMGSGETAHTLSSVTLSLIESFYRAGFQSDNVLSLVNKLLAIHTSDSFSALDVAVLDLTTLSCDFIKFGAPRSFLVSKNGIRIVEGSTLPMGIVKDVEPTVYTASLSEDDALVFMSDGVADAFRSTSDLLDFLKTVPFGNPENLAEEILEKAKALGGEPVKDDMTVLVSRVFSRGLPS